MNETDVCLFPGCNNTVKKGCKTCSRECGDKLKKINSREIRKCLNCFSDFEIRKKITNKLCSDSCRKEWALKPENKEQRLKAAEEAVFKKHGVNTTLKLNEVKEKILKTKIDKYGDKNYNNYEKAKKTNLEKYNVEHGLQADHIREKGKTTKKEKYNDENYNNRDKASKTTFEKYGVEYAIQKDEFKAKQKQTNLELYNVNNPMQNEPIKNKQIATVEKRYGVKSVSQLQEVKEKITKAWRDKIESTVAYKLVQNLDKFDLKLLDNFIGITHPTYSKDVTNTNIEYEFECLKCSNKFISTFANYTLPVCRVCIPFNHNSNTQCLIRDFLNNNNIKFVENTRRIIRNFELDFFIPEKNIAIEINGNYFHSERAGGKNKEYHLNKTIACEKEQIRLIHLFEDEIINKTDIVCSRLKSILNISLDANRVYARECVVKEIDHYTCNQFLTLNHIQGSDKSSVKFGLFYKNNLISVITFGKGRVSLGQKSNEQSWELIRFCSKINYIIPGAFQKLLKHFLDQYKPNKIITYADIRFSGMDYSQTVYEKSGFDFKGFSKPNYWYFKKGNYLKRHHRFVFAKHKLIELTKNIPDKDQNFTEWELAQLLGMDRIWDCGHMRFEYLLK